MTRPDNLKVLPGETWPQYLRRLWPEIAEIDFEEQHDGLAISSREQEIFRFGILWWGARDVFDHETYRRPLTPKQIVERLFAKANARRDQRRQAAEREGEPDRP